MPFNPVAWWDIRSTPPQPVYHDNSVHDSEGVIREGVKLSGNAYLRIRPRELAGTGPTTRLLILIPVYCGHGTTICYKCADSWNLDYEVFFDGTQGAKRLKEKHDKWLKKKETDVEK